MKTINGLLVAVLLLAAGCSSGGGKAAPPTQPPVPGPGARSESEPNDFTAQSFGALSATDFVVSGTSASDADVDLYSVTSSATGGLFVNLDWNSASDLDVAISNSNGVFVRHVDGSGHPETCTLIGLPAGTYTVRVGSFTNAATGYTLTLGQR